MTVGMIPDGTNWVDAYGRTWTSHGDDMVLWSDPVITLLGDNPQKMPEGAPYVEAGATAVDADGTDITGDIVITNPVEPDVPGEYHVTYDVTDSQGASASADREVLVLDINRPDVRETIAALLEAKLPDGVYVYQTAAEQVKLPAVVIGTMSWVPARQNSLKTVRWTCELVCLVQRGAPTYGQITLETLGMNVATGIVADGFVVNGFSSEGSSEVGGVEAMSGVLEVDYLSSERATLYGAD